MVSSANMSAIECESDRGKSLIYIKNNSGPRTEPCGTPAKTLPGPEYLPDINVF